MGVYPYLNKCIGADVFHKMQGLGKVIDCDSNTGTMVLQFRSSKLKVQFPDSFRDGIIYFPNEVVEELKRDLEESKKELCQKEIVKNSLYSRTKSENNRKRVSSSKKNVSKANRKEKHKSRSVKTNVKKSKAEVIDNPYDWDEKQIRSCDTCMLMKREDCAGLRDAITCDSYTPVPHITKAEQYTWPKQGDASSFKYGKKKR